MATFISDVITPEEMTGYVRDTQVLQGPTLEEILPERTVEDIEQELVDLETPLVQRASYRAWDTPNPLGKRPVFARRRVELAPLGLALQLNEKELARFTKLRAAQPGGTDRDIWDDVKSTALACRVRQEASRSDLLLDGKVTINENGFNPEDIDFGVPGAQIVTAATLWSDRTNAVPLTNLLAWEAVFRSNNGGNNPDGWLMSSEVVGDLSFNVQVRTNGNLGGAGAPALIPQEQLPLVLRVFGVKAPIVIFDGQIPDANLAVGPTVPVRKVIGFRRGMGETLVGTSPSAQLLMAQGLIKPNDVPGVVSFATETITPASVTTTSEAVSIPVLRDPKALFVATV